MSKNNTLVANKSNNRQSNIELLRIIAMVLIIAHHFSIHGGFNFATSNVTINRLWIQFIQLGGKIGVDIFVIISGYFLITAKSNKISKILKLWVQIFMYSIGIYALFIITGIETYKVEDLISCLLPITYSRWWFASAYFVLYLISPYLNMFLTSLDKHTYQRILVLTTLLWCIMPTLFKTSFQSSYLIWFMYLYALAGYIRLHIKDINISNKKCTLVIFICVAIAFLNAVFCDYVGIRCEDFLDYATKFYGMQTLPVVLISVFTFILFLNLNIKHNKIINCVASATFGVYLIHDNGFVRTFLWKTVFRNASFSESAFLIPYSVAVIAIVFVICTIIELFRIYILEKHYLNFLDKFSSKINGYIEKFFNLKFFKE